MLWQLYCWSYMSCKIWMIRGSPRAPDRLPDYLALMCSSQRSLGQWQVHVGHIIWVVLPHLMRPPFASTHTGACAEAPTTTQMIFVRRHTLINGGGWVWRCHGVETMASIVVRGGVRVCVFGGSGGLKNTRITEGMQWFILVWVNRCPTSSS
jgi:hypothetical protein